MENHQSLSEQLTPVEIKNKEFHKTLWGYSPKDVVFYLDQIARHWELVQKEERTLLKKISDLNNEVHQWENKEEQITLTLEQAKAEAKKIRDKATEEATRFLQGVKERSEEIRRNTEEWLEKIIDEVERTQSKKKTFLNALKSTLDQHYSLLEDEASLPNFESHLAQLKQSVSHLSHMEQ